MNLEKETSITISKGFLKTVRLFMGLVILVCAFFAFKQGFNNRVEENRQVIDKMMIIVQNANENDNVVRIVRLSNGMNYKVSADDYDAAPSSGTWHYSHISVYGWFLMLSAGLAVIIGIALTAPVVFLFLGAVVFESI